MLIKILQLCKILRHNVFETCELKLLDNVLIMSGNVGLVAGKGFGNVMELFEVGFMLGFEFEKGLCG